MKKMVILIFLISFVSFLFSCSEKGGTIIVKNNYSEDKVVTVYSGFKQYGILFYYEDEYGPRKILAESTGNFNVKSNTEYCILWNNNKGIDEYKKINVCNGETVEIKIP